MSAATAVEPRVHAGLQHLHRLTGRAAAELDTLTHREVLLLTEQVASVATAVQALAISAMTAEAEGAATDPTVQPATGTGGGDLVPDPEFVPDEVGLLLRCSTAAAHRRCRIAHDASRHPGLVDHWLAGVISPAAAEVIGELLAPLDPRDPAVYDLVLDAVDYATAHRPAQTRAWLSRRILATDPATAEQQRRRAFAARRIELNLGPDGMGSLWAWLPAVQARQIYDTVDTLARAAGSDDARGMNQRRADAFVDLLLGRAAPPQVQIQVVAPLDTLSGASDRPAEVTGAGPLLPDELADLLTAMTSAGSRMRQELMITDPDTGHLIATTQPQYRPSASLQRAVRARDVECRFPGCRRTAASAGTDLDHTIPWPAGDTGPHNLAVLCRHHHRLKHSPGWHAHLEPDGVLTWTTPDRRTFQTTPWTYSDPRDP